MRSTVTSVVLFWSMLALCGCRHYEYRLVEPAQYARVIGKEPVTIPYDPLQYRLARQNDHLAMRIVNPTDDPVRLLENKSYAIDPQGETHPVRGHFIAPHSYVRLNVPSIPITYTVYNTPPPLGFYPGWSYPFHSSYPFYDPFFYEPYPSSYQVRTPYDWDWKEGPVRLHLGYDRAGKEFEHNFVFERRRVR
jgi:hypothetical protein